MWENVYTNPEGLTDNKVQQEELERSARERYEYCLKVASVFRGKTGKELLSRWRAETIEKPCRSSRLIQEMGKDAAQAYAFEREGQSAFVADIELCLRIADECKTLDQFYQNISQLGKGMI